MHLQSLIPFLLTPVLALTIAKDYGPNEYQPNKCCNPVHGTKEYYDLESLLCCLPNLWPELKGGIRDIPGTNSCGVKKSYAQKYSDCCAWYIGGGQSAIKGPNTGGRCLAPFNDYTG